MTHEENQLDQNQLDQNQLDQIELDWLACCYVIGELDSEQLEAFETRLSTDQVARDSIVRAMQQTQLLFDAFQAESGDSGASGLDGRLLKSATSSHATSPHATSAANAPAATFRSAPTWLALAAAVLLIASAWQWFTCSDFSETQSVAVTSPNDAERWPVIDADRVTEERLANAWFNTIANDSMTSVDSELLTFVADDIGYSDVVFETEGWLVEAIEADTFQPGETEADSAEDADSHSVPGLDLNDNFQPFTEGVF
jgi:anti-sigma-K factor RskA